MACASSIKTAQPKQPIPGSMASPGCLAHVVTSKFVDHIPLYRQEAIFQRMGVEMARHTLSHWLIKVAALAAPVYQLLRDEIEQYGVVYADETTT